MHGYDTEVVNVNDPDDTDLEVVGNVHDNVDEAVEDDIEAQYFDGPKNNDTDGQNEQENWSEPEDSDDDVNWEGTEVPGEEVTWSDVENSHSVLDASADPLNVWDGKWQNEAQGRPTKSVTRTISENSKYLST